MRFLSAQSEALQFFSFFLLPSFRGSVVSPFPQSLEGRLNQRIIEDSVPLKYEAARKNHK
jgi:hypothetical protein